MVASILILTMTRVIKVIPMTKTHNSKQQYSLPSFLLSMPRQLIVRSNQCLFVPYSTFILITSSPPPLLHNMFINSKSILVCIHLKHNPQVRHLVWFLRLKHPMNRGSMYVALVAFCSTPPTPRARVITMKKRMTLV